MNKIASMLAATVMAITVAPGQAEAKSQCQLAITDIRTFNKSVALKIQRVIEGKECPDRNQWGMMISKLSQKLDNLGNKCKEKLTGNKREDFQKAIEEVVATIGKIQDLEAEEKEKNNPKSKEETPYHKKGYDENTRNT